MTTTSDPALCAIGDVKIDSVSSAFRDNSNYGISLSDRTSLVSTNDVFTRNRNAGLIANSSGNITLTGAQISLNLGEGVRVDKSDSGDIRITNSMVRENTRSGVGIADESKRVMIRGTSFLMNYGSGVDIAGTVGVVSNVDLGTVNAPGANVFGSDGDANLLAGFCNNGGASVNARGNRWSSCPPTVSIACSGKIALGGSRSANVAECSSP